MRSVLDKLSWESAFILLGMFAGFVKVCERLLRHEKVTIVELLAQSVVSAFACLLCGMMLKATMVKAPVEVILFLSGMMGYMGMAGIWYMVGIAVKKQIGKKGE